MLQRMSQLLALSGLAGRCPRCPLSGAERPKSAARLCLQTTRSRHLQLGSKFSGGRPLDPNQWPRPLNVYDVILLIGTSKESWEKAAANAVEQASKTLRNLRVAEIVELDMQLDAKGKVEAYRAKVRLSFKVER
jgi:dodecin